MRGRTLARLALATPDEPIFRLVRRQGPYVSVVPTGSEATIFSDRVVDPIRDHRNAVAFTYSAVIAAGSTFSILLTRTLSTSVRAHAASAEGLSAWRNLWAQFETLIFLPSHRFIHKYTGKIFPAVNFPPSSRDCLVLSWSGRRSCKGNSALYVPLHLCLTPNVVSQFPPPHCWPQCRDLT